MLTDPIDSASDASLDSPLDPARAALWAEAEAQFVAGIAVARSFTSSARAIIAQQMADLSEEQLARDWHGTEAKLEESPDDLDALFAMGALVEFHQHDPEAARAWYTRAADHRSAAISDAGKMASALLGRQEQQLVRELQESYAEARATFFDLPVRRTIETRYTFDFVDPAGDVRTVTFAGGRLVELGSELGSHLRLEGMARRHARISLELDGAVLRAFEPTWLNDETVSEDVTLRIGDFVQMGEYGLVLARETRDEGLGEGPQDVVREGAPGGDEGDYVEPEPVFHFTLTGPDGTVSALTASLDDTLSVGSDEEAGLRLEGVSPQSAELTFVQHPVVFNHEADAPLKVNGVRRLRAQLAVGDVVEIGAYRLVLTRDTRTEEPAV